MPRYKVIAPGYANSHLYSPHGKRKFLDRDKPFTKKDPMPSWLEKMSEKETVAQRKQREAEEAAAAQANADQVNGDQKEIANKMFTGAGENAPGGAGPVETL